LCIYASSKLLIELLDPVLLIQNSHGLLGLFQVVNLCIVQDLVVHEVLDEPGHHVRLCASRLFVEDEDVVVKLSPGADAASELAVHVDVSLIEHNLSFFLKFFHLLSFGPLDALSEYHGLVLARWQLIQLDTEED